MISFFLLKIVPLHRISAEAKMEAGELPQDEVAPGDFRYLLVILPDFGSLNKG